MPGEQSAARSARPFARAAKILAGETTTGVPALAAAAEQLRPIAPDLPDIVGSSAVRAHAEAYPRYAAEAARQRELLMREATLANLCLMVAGVLSGLVLVGPTAKGLLGDVLTERATLGIGIATLALCALAAMFSYQARESDRLRRWFAARSTAEMARLNAFRAIATGAATGAPDTAGAGLALIWRHLFEDQREWLVAQAACHRRSSERTNFWGGIGAALAFVGGSGAVIAGSGPSRAGTPWPALSRRRSLLMRTNREGLRRDRPMPIGTRRRSGPRPARGSPGRVADEVAAGEARRCRFRRGDHQPAMRRAQAVARWRHTGGGGIGQTRRAPEGTGRCSPQGWYRRADLGRRAAGSRPEPVSRRERQAHVGWANNKQRAFIVMPSTGWLTCGQRERTRGEAEPRLEAEWASLTAMLQATMDAWVGGRLSRHSDYLPIPLEPQQDRPTPTGGP